MYINRLVATCLEDSGRSPTKNNSLKNVMESMDSVLSLPLNFYQGCDFDEEINVFTKVIKFQKSK